MDKGTGVLMIVVMETKYDAEAINKLFLT